MYSFRSNRRGHRGAVTAALAALTATALLAGCTDPPGRAAEPFPTTTIARLSGTMPASTAGSAGPTRAAGSAPAASATAAMSRTSPRPAGQSLGAAAPATPGSDDCPVAATPGSATGLLGEEDGGTAILKFLGEGAAEFARDESFGWVLSVLKGEKGDRSTTESTCALQRQVAQVQESMNQLQEQVIGLRQNIDELSRLVVKTSYQNRYESHLATMDTALGHLTTDQQAYDHLASVMTSAYQLKPVEQSALDAMSGASGDLSLLDIINQLDTQMSTGGESSMINLMAAVTASGLDWQSDKTERDTKNAPRFVSSDYVNPLYDQLEYFSNKLIQAYFLFSESTHLQDPTSTAVSQVDGYVHKILDKWQKMVRQNAYGYQRMPDGTVLDTTTNLLWTAEPITPAGGTTSTACGSGSAFCLADRYGADGSTVATAWVPDTVIGNGGFSTLGGYRDWRLPTAKDLATLHASNNDGLGVWGPAQGLAFLEPNGFITFRNGNVYTKSEDVAPILSWTDKFQVYGAANPYTNGSLYAMPSPADGHRPAGQVIAVRDYTPPTALRKAGGSLTATASEAPAGATSMAPQTFSTPTACGTTTYTVPDGALAVQVSAVGGAGAAGAYSTGKAGRGATVDTVIPATPGSKLQIQVGGNGAGQTGGIGGGADGGSGAPGSDGKIVPGTPGGGGGGASGVAADCGTWLVVAGGGGGTGGTYTVAGSGGNIGAGASTDASTGGDGGARGLTDEQAPQAGTETVAGCGGKPGHGQAAPPDYTSGPSAGGAAGANGKYSANAGSTGSAMKGGRGGDGTAMPVPGAKYLSGAGGGGGAGFSGGGSGGGAGEGKCNGGGGAGGASYVIDTNAWLIDPKTTYGIADAGQQPSVVITPLHTVPPVRQTTYTFMKTAAANTQMLEVNQSGDQNSGDGTVDTWQRIVTDDLVQANELWTYQQEGPFGRGLIRNHRTNWCLQVNGTNGTIDQWPCFADAFNHLWKLVPRPSGGTALQITLEADVAKWRAGTYYLATQQPSTEVANGSRLTLVTDPSDERTAWEATIIK